MSFKFNVTARVNRTRKKDLNEVKRSNIKQEIYEDKLGIEEDNLDLSVSPVTSVLSGTDDLSKNLVPCCGAVTI